MMYGAMTYTGSQHNAEHLGTKINLSGQENTPLGWNRLTMRWREATLNVKFWELSRREEDGGIEAVIKAAKRWLYHIIPALPLSSLTTLPLFQPSFHLCAAFKTCQLTFQRTGWTSWCLCGGLPLGLCVALSLDGHMGSCLCLSAQPRHSHCSQCHCVFNVYAFGFFSLYVSKQWPVSTLSKAFIGVI